MPACRVTPFELQPAIKRISSFCKCTKVRDVVLSLLPPITYLAQRRSRGWSASPSPEGQANVIASIRDDCMTRNQPRVSKSESTSRKNRHGFLHSLQKGETIRTQKSH
jgi:hypothetical protein